MPIASESNAKLVDVDTLKDRIHMHREAWDTVVFTNGCFDILHAGHVRYLEEARSYGDLLVVGLNSDVSVRLIKGDKRPIQSQAHRAEVLSALSCVDYIVLFDEPDPKKLIELLVPDVLVKGADWEADEIIGADIVQQAGGRVVRVPLTPEISTSGIIEKIVQLYG